MFRGRLLVIAVLCAAVAPARGEKLAIADIHGESDVIDEAGALTLIVRSALPGSDRTLLVAPQSITLVTAPSLLHKIGADHVMLAELSREGTGLRVTLVIAGDEEPDISYVRAGDGDLAALAKGVLDRVTTTLHLEPSRVPDASLGRLRPYAVAIRSADPAAAAQALADGSSQTALAVPAAPAALRDLVGNAPTRELAVIAGRAIADPRRLAEVGKTDGGTALAARVFAAMIGGNTAAADKELTGKLPADALVTLARARVAELHGDDTALRDRLIEGLASDQQRAVLAFASTITPARLSPELHRALVGFAEKHATESPGVVARIGLAAAERGVEVARALALVTVRELDTYELARLEPLVAKGDDPTLLRLRAELAMRKADGTESVAIAAFLRAAPSDPRAHRYQGWQRMAEDRAGEAAIEFEKAGARHEHARALLAAGDLKSALAAVGDTPTSPEQLVIKTRIAIADNQIDAAVSAIDLAERAAPANPLVHATVLMLSEKKPDAARAALSKLLIDKGGSRSVASSVSQIKITTEDVGSAEQSDLVKADSAIVVDTDLIAPLLDALPELQQLEHRRIAVAELRYQEGTFGFRVVHASLVRAALVQLLAASPYHLLIDIRTRPFEGEADDPKQLATLTETSDAVLIYGVTPAGGRTAEVALRLYKRGAGQETKVTHVMTMPGLVKLDIFKIVMIGGGTLVVLLALGLWVTRAHGRVKLVIDRAADITDEVLCVELAETSLRPSHPEDLAAWSAATKKSGLVTKPRSGTLVANGATFKLPAGTWYVHLHGSYVRGGKLRGVSDSCTQKVVLRRGDVKELTFDLTAKHAELTVVIEGEPRRGVAIWVDDDEHAKMLTNSAGEAMLMLPIGTHVIHIEQNGQRLDRTEQILSLKMHRMTINVARELRLAAGIKLDGIEPTEAPAPPPPAEPVIKIGAAKPALAATQPIATSGAPEIPRQFERPITPLPGTTLLGRYRVTQELGRGAMGVVHRAWDEKLEREVAIKEMADDLRSHPEAMKLFTQEAKALAQLNHTNIVAMYDQITDESSVLMVMEFVDGEPLEKVISTRGTLPWLEAAGIVDQVCAGLAYAHARKVIHRDIKPANIFLSKDRTVKIGDFGLARVMREVTIKRTEIRGTPLYMAPEQITGTDVDHRADLYAVGCTMFEMVTGRPPFIDGDILYAQLSQQPPVPSSLAPDLPKELDELILALLSKQADGRPGTANDVRTKLKRLFDT